MNEGTISYKTSHNVMLSAEPSFIAVDKTDWERIKRDLESCKSSYDWWTCFGSIFIGGFFSAIITRCSLTDSPENKEIKIILLCSSIACLIIGILCFVARKNNDNAFNKSLSNIKQDIKDVEKKLNI